MLLTGTFFLAVLIGPAALAQTYTGLHSFTSGSDGSQPWDIVLDRQGHIYGNTYGGTDGSTSIYELKRSGNGWIAVPLLDFHSASTGWYPEPVIFGPDGSLYGSTGLGGSCAPEQYGCGLVYKLTPPASSCRSTACPWVETVLYDFQGGADGQGPQGPVTFAPDGSIYGTARGGIYSEGNVFKLTPSNGGWTESVVYSFTGGSDGGSPGYGVILDQAGNLYGVTQYGGAAGLGTVYELSPSNNGWTEAVLHSFASQGDGDFPLGAPIFDQAGNLYGGTPAGGYGGGVVYKLTPGNGSWTESILYYFSGGGSGVWAQLTMDASGNLYGTTYNNPSAGSVFKLAPSNGLWTKTELYNFHDGSDGGYPFGNVVFDSNGNLYGAASQGGDYQNQICENLGCGVVWEITP